MATTDKGLTGTQKRVRERSRVEMSEPLTVGERVADSAAGVIGSWRFIIIQTILVVIWVILNVIAWDFRWDVYPFVLLNLMFSVQAAYTGPILLLASNRQATKDRAMAQRDDEELGVIYKLQHEQMQILNLLQDAQEKHSQILEMVRRQNDARGTSQPRSWNNSGLTRTWAGGLSSRYPNSRSIRSDSKDQVRYAYRLFKRGNGRRCQAPSPV